MLRNRILNVISSFPRSTALIRFQVNKDGSRDWVDCNEVRKELRAMEVEGLVISGAYVHHKGQIEWSLKAVKE